MTLTLAVTLLGEILEDADLLALTVLDDLRGNARALDGGSAELGVLAVDDGENLVELDVVARLDGQLLDKQRVALRDVVLLPAGTADSLQVWPLFPLLRTRSRGCPA